MRERPDVRHHRLDPVVISFLTTLSPVSFSDEVSQLVRSTSAATGRAAIVILAQPALASGVSEVRIIYSATPNTSRSPTRTLSVPVVEPPQGVHEHHAACQEAYVALEKGYWSAFAVMQAYGTPQSALPSVCPCRWALSSLPQWQGAVGETSSAWTRVLGSEAIWSLLNIRVSTVQTCRPYHRNRCSCVGRREERARAHPSHCSGCCCPTSDLDERETTEPEYDSPPEDTSNDV